MDIRNLLRSIGTRQPTPVEKFALGIAGLPFFEKEQRRAELDRVAGLKPVVRLLDTVHDRWATEQTARAERAAVKRVRVEELEVSLRIAKEEYFEAIAAANAADVGERDERADLEAQLRKEADPRLAELADHCAELEEAARLSFWFFPVIGERAEGGGRKPTRIVTNEKEVTAARSALSNLARDARAGQLVPATFDESTQWILSRLQSISPVLQALDLRVLDLDEAGNLKRDFTMSIRSRTSATIRRAGGDGHAPDLPEVDHAAAKSRAKSSAA